MQFKKLDSEAWHGVLGRLSWEGVPAHLPGIRFRLDVPFLSQQQFSTYLQSYSQAPLRPAICHQRSLRLIFHPPMSQRPTLHVLR